MDLQKRLKVLQGLAFRNSGIGKTAIMKCVFFLQTIYNVPLGYRFEIYTYGPFSSEVMEELDYARQLGYIEIHWTFYPSGMQGYSISAKTRESTNYDDELDKVIDTFGSKSARELELLSTVLFIRNNHDINKWSVSKDSICSEVQEIKPRFSREEIERGYEFMKEHTFI